MEHKSTAYRRARKVAAIAYHEAGHAVVGCLMDNHCSVVRIQPGNMVREENGMIIRGYVNPIPPSSWPSSNPGWRDYATRYISMILAGPLAETLYTRCWQDLPMNDGDDEFMAFEVVELVELTRKRCHDFVNRVRWRTLEILQSPAVWAAVDAIAQELIKRGRLNGKQIRAMVQRVFPVSPIKRQADGLKVFSVNRELQALLHNVRAGRRMGPGRQSLYPAE